MMLMAFNTFDKICWKYFATKNNTLYMFNNITYCSLTKNIQYNHMLSQSLYYIHLSGWLFLIDVYVMQRMKTIRRKLTFRNWPQNHIACYKDNQLYPWKLISISLLYKCFWMAIRYGYACNANYNIVSGNQYCRNDSFYWPILWFILGGWIIVSFCGFCFHSDNTRSMAVPGNESIKLFWDI